MELPLHAGPQFHLHISDYMSTHAYDCAHTQLYDFYPTQDHGAWPQIAQLLLYKYTAVLPVCFTQVSHSMMSKFWNVIDSKLIRAGCVWLLIDSLD